MNDFFLQSTRTSIKFIGTSKILRLVEGQRKDFKYLFFSHPLIEIYKTFGKKVGL